jgi:hypothetical protein
VASIYMRYYETGASMSTHVNPEKPRNGSLFIGDVHLVLTRKEARALERAAYELATALEELELDAPEPVEAA